MTAHLNINKSRFSLQENTKFTFISSIFNQWGWAINQCQEWLSDVSIHCTKQKTEKKATCLLSSASFSFFSINSCEIERSFGGELEIIAGGFSVAAGFRITSNAKPPAFARGLSVNIIRQHCISFSVIYRYTGAVHCLSMHKFTEVQHTRRLCITTEAKINARNATYRSAVPSKANNSKNHKFEISS